jgi:hypothetical protein
MSHLLNCLSGEKGDVTLPNVKARVRVKMCVSVSKGIQASIQCVSVRECLGVARFISEWYHNTTMTTKQRELELAGTEDEPSALFKKEKEK